MPQVCCNKLYLFNYYDCNTQYWPASVRSSVVSPFMSRFFEMYLGANMRVKMIAGLFFFCISREFFRSFEVQSRLSLEKDEYLLVVIRLDRWKSATFRVLPASAY